MNTILTGTDNVPYVGDVKLSLRYKNGKEVEISRFNHSTNYLSLLFAKSVLGYDISDLLPQFLVIDCTESSAESDVNYIRRTTSPILLTGLNYNYDSNGRYYAQYNAVVSFSSLNAQTADEKTRFSLTTKDNNSLVYLDILNDNDTPKKLSDLIANDNTIIVVNWKLKLVDN